MGYFVLQDKKMQRKVVDGVTKSLSHQVGSKVSIDEIEWNFPNSFVLKDVYIEDLSQDTLLFMDRTKVTVNMWKLFSSQVSFRTIQFTGLKANLSMDSTHVPNFQFFIDAFKRDNNDTLSLKWSMDIESAAFEDCAISYKNPYVEQKLIGRFNPNDLQLTSINGCVFVRSFLRDSVSILMEGLSFKEKSGLEVSDISSKLAMNSEELTVSDFKFQTPNSNLSMDKVQVYHDNYTAFRDPLHKLRFYVSLKPSVLKPSDFSAFRPALDNLDETVSLKGVCYGYATQLQVADLSVQYGKATCVSGNMFLKNAFPDITKIYVDGNLEKVSSNAQELSDILAVGLNRDIKLPVVLDSLGEFSYQGTLQGDLSNVETIGMIKSNAGTIDTKVSFKSKDLQLNEYKVTGKIQSNQCHLNKAFGEKSQLGNMVFSFDDIELNKYSDRNFSLNLNGTIDSLYYRDYCYENISINGLFNNEGFDGKLIMSDKNAEMSFLGKVDLSKEKPLFHFVASVNSFNLSKTNLLNAREESKLSFEIETNFVGKNLDDLEGSFSMDNIFLEQESRELVINNFSLSATANGNNGKKLTVLSDYLNGSLVGKYNFTTIPLYFYNLAHRYLPALVKDEKEIDNKGKRNDFKFDFTIENLEPIHEVYPLPLVVVDEARLTGFYNDSTNKVKVRLASSQMKRKNSYWNDFVFQVDNPHDEMKLLCRATMLPANKARNPYFVAINSRTKENEVYLDANFSNSVESTYSGKLDLKAVFKDFVKGEGVTADFYIRPTNVILNDTIWNIKESKVAIDKKLIEVDSFLFNHDTQFLSINGRNSSLPSDSINVHFSDLHLGYISDILSNKNITFSGVADGDMFLFQLFNHPYFKGELYVYDAGLNDCVLGDMSVNSSWLDNEKCIDFDVKLLTLYNDQLSKSLIHGGVFLGNDSLFIGGNLKDVSLKFLRKYIGKVLQNNTGTVSGDVKAYGKFGNIGLEGKAYARNFAFDVDYLKTSYVLSDTVYLTPNTIGLNQTQLFDSEGHYGVISGLLFHEGFKNIKFAFDMDCKNLLLLNTREEDNETFYGKAYADGEVHFSGVPERVNINLNMKTMPNTLVTIPLEGSSTAKEGDFITFVEKEDNKTMAEKRKIRRDKIRQLKEQQTTSPTEINLMINLDATPDAQVHLVMDAQQGDLIRANGTGSLQLLYNTKESDFRMYGGYEILKGDYLFTIQSIISKKFDILEGSTVQWTGSPYNAAMNIRAKYALNAPLYDIVDDPNLSTGTSLVHCLLNLTGTIASPTIKFDIDLPNSGDDVRSKLRSVLNTEEAMNRNIASLMALGHFYNIDKDVNTIATTELSSVGFSTLSSQLTNWISKLNQDISIGVNYRPGSATAGNSDKIATSSEFDVALSTQLLNDRLLLNGNFGYRDNVEEAKNVSNSIVDFDIEYKINKSGRLRTKAFNRSNNSYFKQAPNTQGIGIVYHEDFDTFSGLLHDYWQALKRRKEMRKEKKALKESEAEETVKP